MATLRYKAKEAIEKLFGVLTRPEAGELYPEDFREQFARHEAQEQARARIAYDYIVGMTDGYALRLYSRLFSSESTPLYELL